ncbi:MAG: flagellar motor switch protein FliM [Acidimicrobiales bacterium]
MTGVPGSGERASVDQRSEDQRDEVGGQPAPGGFHVGEKVGGEVRLYDFHHQDALDRTRLRRFHPLLETLGHRMAANLTTNLRAPVHIEIGEQEQCRWDEFSGSLPEPTFLASATLIPLGGRVMLHVPLDLAMLLVDFRLGGSGWGQFPLRPLTEIEQKVVSDVVAMALSEIGPSLSPVIPVQIGALTQAASAMFLQIAKPSEICLVVPFSLEVGDGLTGNFSLTFPLNVMLPILEALDRLEVKEMTEDQGDSRKEVESVLQETLVDLTVIFPEVTLSSDQILELRPGNVIPLRREQGEPLRLQAGGMTICHVLPASKGKRLACIVVESQEDRGVVL